MGFRIRRQQGKYNEGPIRESKIIYQIPDFLNSHVEFSKRGQLKVVPLANVLIGREVEKEARPRPFVISPKLLASTAVAELFWRGCKILRQDA